MKCPNCGNEVSEEFKFCNSCGIKLQKAESAENSSKEEVASESQTVAQGDAGSQSPFDPNFKQNVKDLVNDISSFVGKTTTSVKENGPKMLSDAKTSFKENAPKMIGNAATSVKENAPKMAAQAAESVKKNAPIVMEKAGKGALSALGSLLTAFARSMSNPIVAIGVISSIIAMYTGWYVLKAFYDGFDLGENVLAFLGGNFISFVVAFICFKKSKKIENCNKGLLNFLVVFAGCMSFISVILVGLTILFLPKGFYLGGGLDEAMYMTEKDREEL